MKILEQAHQLLFKLRLRMAVRKVWKKSLKSKVRDLESYETTKIVDDEISELPHIAATDYTEPELPREMGLQPKYPFPNNTLTITFTRPLTIEALLKASKKALLKVEEHQPKTDSRAGAIILTHYGLRKSMARKRWGITFDTANPTQIKIRHYSISPEDSEPRTRPLKQRDKKQIVNFIKRLG